MAITSPVRKPTAAREETAMLRADHALVGLGIGRGLTVHTVDDADRLSSRQDGEPCMAWPCLPLPRHTKPTSNAGQWAIPSTPPLEVCSSEG